VERGTLSQTEGRFLARLLLLQQLAVHQIMTPRPEVVTLSIAWNREQILATARQVGFNRYPVVERERAQPCGLFHLKDLLRQPDVYQLRDQDLRELMYVPESKDVAALLTEMRTGGTHLAAVVDEHGDFTGIVTLADCLRALMGPPGGGDSRADPEIFQLGPQLWVIGGRLDLRQLNEACGVALPTSRDYVTVAGFVMARLGRIPRPGDQVAQADARLTVLEMTDNKIVRLQVEKMVTPPGEEIS
jgi:CBS domain containing-hemolysin-like protein